MSLLLLFNRRRTAPEPEVIPDQGGNPREKRKRLRPRITTDARRRDNEYWRQIEDEEILVILLAMKGK